jgi:2-polyprenyl-3-methyl-5-hydroxy-6-metoxy-1,4-benzoquinol methylase
LKNTFLTCQDYTVSNESFDLILDEELDMLITSPKPKNEDLGKYYESEKYISHTDSKQTFFDKIYQTVKTYTVLKKVKFIDGFVDSTLIEKTLLDVGCGTGDFLVKAKKSNWIITGVEPNASARKIAKEKTSHKILKDISESNSSKYDVITLWHVLEHVPNLTEYISQLKQLLKPDGTLLIAVPNYRSYDAKYYGKFWAAYDVPRHLWHFSKKSIKGLFGKEKMEVVKIYPMLFDSFYVSLLSEKYKRGKQNPIKAFFVGLYSNILAIRSKEYSSHVYVIKNNLK